MPSEKKQPSHRKGKIIEIDAAKTTHHQTTKPINCRSKVLCAGTETISADKAKHDDSCPGPYPCPPSFVKVSQVTVCEPIVPPNTSDVPHAIFPRQEKIAWDTPPQAPIVYNTMTGGTPIVFGGATYYLRAGVADTACRMEELAVVFPAGYNSGYGTSPISSYASDLAIRVVSGTLTVTINGSVYTLTAGGYALIHKGSVFSIVNGSATDPAQFFISGSPGFAGAYNDAAVYQASVGGAANVDPCMIQQIFARYNIFPAQGYSVCVNGQAIVPAPNTTRFLPTPNAKCRTGSWGLGCDQILVLTVNNLVPVGQAGFTKPAATIGTKDLSSYVVTENLDSLQLSAVILLDPKVGTTSRIANPTVNGLAVAPLAANTNYYVEYSEKNNNVTVRPLVFSMSSILP